MLACLSFCGLHFSPSVFSFVSWSLFYEELLLLILYLITSGIVNVEKLNA
jgi:hypothetical protein